MKDQENIHIMSKIRKSNKHKIKVISFDLDDTIWKCENSLILAYEAQDNHIINNFPSIDKYMKDNEITVFGETSKLEKLNEYKAKKHDYTFMRKLALKEIAKQAGKTNQEQIEFSEAVFNDFITVRSNVLDSVFENTLESLEKLKEAGYIIGSISNGNANIHHHDEISNLLGKYHVLSEEVEDAKPHKAPFEKFYSLILKDYPEVKKNQILHVGDCLNSDVFGAKQFGFLTAWIFGDNLTQEKQVNKNNKIYYKVNNKTFSLEDIEALEIDYQSQTVVDLTEKLLSIIVA